MKVLIGNFKGPKGDTGSKGDKGDTGNTGETGQRGSRWTSGTSITGTSTIGVNFPDSGITDAQLSDFYINTDNGNLYECTVPGNADVAEWAYVGNFKGPKGDTGPVGSISDINNQKPTYSEASELKNIESGETVNVSFGKLKKAISVLISHYMQKATQSILGHVKLSNSAAITTAGEYALDAIEKNASVEGTLANMISQVNSNLSGQSPFNISLKRNYDHTIDSGWEPILEWNDINGRTGYLYEYSSGGYITLILNNEKGDIQINGNSIEVMANTLGLLSGNTSIDNSTNPNNLETGIYQYFNNIFETSPFDTPHILVSFKTTSFVLQIAAKIDGELKYRTRGALENEWYEWRDVSS